MSFPHYPGQSFLTGSFGSCPPPQDCCCEGYWSISPKEKIPKAIDLTSWISRSLAPGEYTLDPELLEFKVTDLNNPTASWPIVAQPPVVLPFVAGSYFTVLKISPYHTNSKQMGYSVLLDIDDTAVVNSRLRIDYKFRVKTNCSDTYEGAGCILVVVEKCPT